MSVNGVTSIQAAAAYSYNSTSAAKEKTSAEEAATKTTEDTGVIYEHSTDTNTSSTKVFKSCFSKLNDGARA